MLTQLMAGLVRLTVGVFRAWFWSWWQNIETTVRRSDLEGWRRNIWATGGASSKRKGRACGDGKRKTDTALEKLGTEIKQGEVVTVHLSGTQITDAGLGASQGIDHAEDALA